MWRRLADALMLVTEALALFVLASGLAATAGGDGPSLLTVLAAIAGGFYLVRFLLNFDTSRPTLLIAAAALSVVALLSLLNLQYYPQGGPLSMHWLGVIVRETDTFLGRNGPLVWGVIIVTVAWFRGVFMAQRDLSYTAALASYTLGLLVVVVVLVIGQGSRAATAIDTAALPYFMLGLLTLAVVHLSQAEHQQSDFLSGPWLLTLGGTVGLLAAISLAIGIFPIDFFNWLLAPVGTLVLLIVSWAIFLIALPIAYLVAWVLQLLLPKGELPRQPPQQLAGEVAEDLRQRAQSGPPEFLVIIAKTLFLFAIFALIGYILWRIFRSLRRPLRGDVDETRESLAAEGSLGEDLSALVSGLLRRFRRPQPMREPNLPADVLAVRRLYLRALERAEAAGTPRPPAATPVEFAPTLAESLHSPAAMPLSDQFSAARYGLVAPSREEVAQLERALSKQI